MTIKVNHALTATDPNSPLIDHDDWNDDHTVTAPATILTKAAVQSIGNAAWTALVFDTEARDDRGWHDNVTNNTRITVDQTSDYNITACFQMVDVNNSDLGIAIYVNGSPVVADVVDTGATNTNRGRAIAQCLRLTSGDYVEIFVYQDSGAARNSVIATTRFSVKGL